MTTVYLPAVGFRRPGLRLAAQVSADVAGRTLTLRDLIATPDGTAVTYDLACLAEDTDGFVPGRDTVVIRSDGAEHPLEPARFSVSAERGGVRRRISSASTIPLRPGRVAVSIAIPRLGEHSFAIALQSFGDATVRARPVDASAEHEAIRIVVRHIALTTGETALDLEVVVAANETPMGIGGLHGSREGRSALALRDETGRAYAERLRGGPGGAGRATDLALFEPLHPDARELELTVPYVFVEEDAKIDVALPLSAPVEANLGRYGIRVLAAGVVEGDPKAPNPPYRGRALRVDFDFGGWHGDRRVLLARSIELDGSLCGVGWRLQNGLNATDPEPVEHLDIMGEGSLEAKMLTFSGPTVQIRGPWRVHFAVA